VEREYRNQAIRLLNRLSYDSIAMCWNSARQDFPTIERLYLDNLLSIAGPDGHILDMGCGSGWPIGSYILQQKRALTAVDHSIQMLNIARTHISGAELILSDISSYVTSKKYGGIVLWDVLFHFPKENHFEILQRAHSLLRKGGAMMVSSGGSGGDAFFRQMYGQTLFFDSHDPHDFLELIQQANFFVIECGFAEPPGLAAGKGRYCALATTM
jgi:2-polyprenyl-3-methyl-5-hydroxy-6-metoxy-1,4-benzoquinol methylase